MISASFCTCYKTSELAKIDNIIILPRPEVLHNVTIIDNRGMHRYIQFTQARNNR
jgi:hypothetical protein